MVISVVWFSRAVVYTVRDVTCHGIKDILTRHDIMLCYMPINDNIASY